MISIFGGTGFIGSSFQKHASQPFVLIDRDSRIPKSRDVLYMISTTDNYNLFENIHQDVDVNISLLLDVLKNLKPGEHIFNFVSSWFVYGETALPATEESVCNPKGFYSITKYAAELLIRSYCETFGIPFRIFRLCNVYGAGDPGVSKKKNALQFLISKLKANEDIQLYHDGHFFRDYMHVGDVSRALDLCVQRAPLNQVTNIGSGQKLVFRDLIEIAGRLTQSKSKIEKIDPPHFHKVVQVKDFYMDVSRLKSLGFEQKIPIEEGLAELCRH